MNRYIAEDNGRSTLNVRYKGGKLDFYLDLDNAPAEIFSEDSRVIGLFSRLDRSTNSPYVSSLSVETEDSVVLVPFVLADREKRLRIVHLSVENYLNAEDGRNSDYVFFRALEYLIVKLQPVFDPIGLHLYSVKRGTSAPFQIKGETTCLPDLS